MKKRKMIITMLLLATMAVSLLAGCKKKQEAEKTGTGQESKTKQENKTEQGGQEEAFAWPLSEKAELTFWLPWSNDYIETPDELIAIQKIEEATNVHINWTTVSDMEASEKLGLLLASSSYPDIFYGLESYASGGLVKAYSDGVIVDLTDYVEKYMPNYQAARTSVERLRQDTLTDDGKILSAWKIYSNCGEIEGEDMWLGMAVRRDWLEECKLEAPSTIAEWHDVLAAFKERYQCEAPLVLGSVTGIDFANHFLSAYGVLGSFYQEDGVVKYGPMEEGYRQWVQTMRDWYAEGLVDPNFTSTMIFDVNNYLAANRSGAGPIANSVAADYLKVIGLAADEEFYLEPVSAPVLNEGDTPMLGAAFREFTGNGLTVSSQCENVELACRWMDYWYTKDCMFLDSFGIEGESYVKNADGSYAVGPVIEELVENGTYQSVMDALYATYTLGNQDFGLYNWAKADVFTEVPASVTTKKLWSQADDRLLLPAKLTLTEEESIAFYSKFTDIQTLVEENTVQFITGSKPIEEYDSFVEQLRQYGIEECIQQEQNALDRFQAR